MSLSKITGIIILFILLAGLLYYSYNKNDMDQPQYFKSFGTKSNPQLPTEEISKEDADKLAREGYAYYIVSRDASGNLTSVKKVYSGDTEIKFASIELENPFFLKEGMMAGYNNSLRFTFKPSTTPMTKDPVTGIEKFPSNLYTVIVSQSKLSTSKAPLPRTETTLYFKNPDSYQEFTIGSEKYELHFLNYNEGKAEFVLEHSTGYKQ